MFWPWARSMLLNIAIVIRRISQNRSPYKSGRGVKKRRSEEVFFRTEKSTKKAQLLWSCGFRPNVPISAREFCAFKLTILKDLNVAFPGNNAKRMPLVVTFSNFLELLPTSNEDYQGIIDGLLPGDHAFCLFSGIIDIPEIEGLGWKWPFC